MLHRFLGTVVLLSIVGLLVYTVLLSSAAQASPKDLNVISQTRGDEVLAAKILNNRLTITLKNNHKNTITAFAISFSDTVVKEDFAYSEVHFGIEPGDTFQKAYAVSTSSMGSEPPPLYLLTVLLIDGSNDGDPKVAQEIRDERLGEKIQILRTLRILEREDQSRKDLKTAKNDLVAALNSGESETLSTLKELEPTGRINNSLSDHLRNGLQVGREKMLRRFEALEQLPSEYQEKGFMELKDRSQKLFAKL